MRLRGVVCASAAAVAAASVPAHSLRAAPPTSRVVAAAISLPQNAQWITHEIVNGESLEDIAERYSVSVGSILRWNQLDPKRPGSFWVGQQLKIQTQLPGRMRQKHPYIVRPGDSWESIAERFHVDRNALQRYWNPQEKELRSGHQITIWVEPNVTPEPLPTADLEVKPVPQGAVSVGYPDSGRLIRGVKIPDNPELYTIRNPDHAFGSTHAISVLQQSILQFRVRTGFEQPVLLWDMSQKRGGRFGPHRSHRSGRDIDIGLPLRPDYVPGVSPLKSAVDWEATWHLVRSFIETGEVRYVFLSRPQQAGLYRAAKACGATAEELDRIVQYPRTEKVGIVRHSPGHTGHLHVRFTCGADETDCQEF